MTVVDLAECREAFERLAISVAGVLEVRGVERATAKAVQAIARKVTSQGPLVEMAAYLLGLYDRDHAEAARLARETCRDRRRPRGSGEGGGMTYDRAAVMKDAHRRYRDGRRLGLGWSWSQCLSTAWAAAKMRREAAERSARAARLEALMASTGRLCRILPAGPTLPAVRSLALAESLT